MGQTFIELHIKCHNETDKDDELRDLGLEIPPVTEYRPFRIRPELIDGFYPTPDVGCFIMIPNGELTVKETFAQLEKLLLCEDGE